MNISIKYFIVFYTIFNGFLYGQNYNTLINQREKFIQETEFLNKLLNDTKNTQTQTIEKLNIINAKISAQTGLLNVYKETIASLKKDQKELGVQINQLEDNLHELKKNYARLIQLNHSTTRGYNRVLFFLSAKNFNQLIRRIHHFKQLTLDRKQKYQEIKQKQTELHKNKQLIIAQKAEQLDLALQKKSELKLLDQTKKDQQKIVEKLINKKDSLIRAIKVKEQETKNITKVIEELIEIEKNKKTNLTPEFKLISSEFSANKGKLPWPVSRGSVVSKFGKIAHPVLAGIFLMNNGVEIATNQTEVRSIFEGEVSKIIVLPTGLKVVIIKHGDYLTVYSNLYDTRVKKGQKVKTKQYIGSLYADSEKKQNFFEFQIWKGREKLNPTDWISGR